MLDHRFSVALMMDWSGSFNRLKGGVCTMYAQRYQWKSSDSQL